MSTRDVPAQKFVICDRCKIEKKSFPTGMKASISTWGADYHGVTVGGTSYEIDMCDSCLGDFNTFMDDYSASEPLPRKET